VRRRALSVLFQLAVCGLAMTFFSLGCGAENPKGRKPLTGRVTLDGAPLAQGNIEFHPLFEGGLQSGGRIASGSYSIPAHEGVVPGKYRVAIQDFIATPPTPAGYMPGDPLPPSPKAKVPSDWNTKSQHTIEVMPQGPFKFNFEVVSKK
jgi:hypothetical protein